ncbi:EAL domain-containing protein [Burkholderia plantarii]|uniref:EAL domain-containing protein n=1 Tax=Burkholderia plantarii TaxID=41899 RepID=UPI00209A6CD3|nr:EAL domain-containing protein [Burkholderia plantarii]
MTSFLLKEYDEPGIHRWHAFSMKVVIELRVFNPPPICQVCAPSRPAPPSSGMLAIGSRATRQGANVPRPADAPCPDRSFRSRRQRRRTRPRPGRILFFMPRPKARLPAHRRCGFEYLIRWRHPEGAVPHPAYFISVVEDSGLAGQFTALPRRLADACRARALAPQGIGIELTCTVEPERPDWLGEAIHAAQAAGARVALDDLGAGFNSLTLQQLPADIVKFDRSLLARLPASASCGPASRTRRGLPGPAGPAISTARASSSASRATSRAPTP